MKMLIGYQNNNSVIHRLDPRIKLLWLTVNLFFVLFLQEGWLLLLSLTLVLLLNRMAGIPLGEFSTLFKILLVIGSQIVILQAFLYQHGTVVGEFLGFNIYLGGIYLGFTSFLVLLNLALLCLQFTIWTSPEDLTLLLVKFRLPPKYAVLVGLSLHFLPVMERDLSAIFDSQQARGLELSTFSQKLKGLIPVMLPLILRALKRGGEVALSMELKGYTLYAQRTFLKTISLSMSDYYAGAVICTYFTLIIFILSRG